MSESVPPPGTAPSGINLALAVEIARDKGALRMSDQELGRRIGVSKNTIQRMMAGESDIDMVRLFKVAAVLGVPPEDLIRRARMAMGGPPPPA